LGANSAFQPVTWKSGRPCSGGGSESYLTEGSLDIETESGDIRVEADDVPLNLRALSEGDVIVNGENSNGRYRSPTSQPGLDVDIDTEDGDVLVDMPDPVSASSTVPTTPTAPTTPTTPTAPTPPGG
jgi:hypothetical protein